MKIGGNILKLNPSINGVKWLMLSHLDMTGSVPDAIINQMTNKFPESMDEKMNLWLK